MFASERRDVAAPRFLLLNAAALALSMSSSHAGPCAPEIERMRAGIGAWIASGPSAPQSVGAMLHHQPTPGSVAAAGERLGLSIAAFAHAMRAARGPQRR